MFVSPGVESGVQLSAAVLNVCSAQPCFDFCLLELQEDSLPAIVEATEGRIVAIDGKTLRHSFDRAADKSALHMISAWAVANGVSLGQRAVDGDSNEITAVPELLKLLELEGAIVTYDAMGCQKEIAQAIRDAGADYVLAVKQNQPRLYEDMLAALEQGIGPV
jgi:Transposase DDE domain